MDEGQRLKNDGSLLYKTLSAFKITHKVLLTGLSSGQIIGTCWILMSLQEHRYRTILGNCSTCCNSSILKICTQVSLRKSMVL